MISVKTRQLRISDVTGKVTTPFLLNNNERAMLPTPFTTSLVMTVTGYKFKGGYTNGGLDPHIPILHLHGTAFDTLLCTNGIMVTIDASDNSSENIVDTVGTNGNFGGVGQPAAPPQFTNAPTLGLDDWVFTLTRDSDTAITYSIVSTDPIYAGISWEDTMEYGSHPWAAAPMDVWVGRVDPAVQARLVAYGYSGQYELQDGVTGVTYKSLVIS